MKKFNFLSLLGLFIIFTLNIVNADCIGNLVSTDTTEITSGQSYPVLITTTIQKDLGQRNIDIYVTDPEGNRISEFYQYYLDNSTYALSFTLNVTDSWIRGTHRLTAIINVWNSSNLQQKICDEEITDTFIVHSNRTSYKDTVIISILPQFQREVTSYEFCDNISVKTNDSEDTIEYPICFKAQNVPTNLQLGVKRIVTIDSTKNISNMSMLIDAKEPLYSYSILESLHNAFKRQSLSISTQEEYLDTLKNDTGKIGILMDRYSEAIETLKEQIFYLQKENANLTATLTERYSTVDMFSLNLQNPYFTFVLGILGTFAVIWYIGKRKEEETKE